MKQNSNLPTVFRSRTYVTLCKKGSNGSKCVTTMQQLGTLRAETVLWDITKRNFSLNSTATVGLQRGQLTCIEVKSLKSRQTNSFLGYFDLGEKTLVPYNLKHLFRTVNT